ncbi:4-(cytidine 5'-diphospho)-2-C-methyl-D-erythritol kinase [Sulfurovum sp. NBC37-1]|uniref:4-diphosphocytidyl-2-C-methyl-D-erythritol kinase n=1 Tax=Sulfurovum sp. (strain NBC37-1) TaxID=387093 RepID=ISPE_SULNB|nr:4-(cytidine 5'-diphospho)-2-C-methyl-D-erythritol kinase [Sulfurovum sp. NBC37-1]A6Q782.1 RecName: Full=4-diphosphocytidyl-2-C-methyl-D-erythritol kinase; Short=CMK; AltName: Full=4-(cytidine-5'-diphospho)-2-C-methyl-D-erythritol kinase [Sulfurovum sp. NBC37-1]BAF71341.1 4-diphosphocytidyl-2C-methyl-D-erythritol kinase [Sulfurovum sp. NBC37-1]
MYSINAHAKVNIFLKITGHENGYHTLLSRFMRVDDLYDTITLVPGTFDSFTLEGCKGVPLHFNTIYKAYEALLEPFPKLEDFFKSHKVVVEKSIPSQAGLGGGSSDAGAFMRLINSLSQNPLSTDALAKLGSSIGADVPFFVYNYPSANVRGFGEIVEPFRETPLKLELFTPDIGCDTAKVYQTYHKYLLRTLDPKSFFGWENMDSGTLLQLIADPVALNDLYPAALSTCPALEKLDTKGWFFSGSGSTFFRVKD